jgi:hypothetical protein
VAKSKPKVSEARNTLSERLLRPEYDHIRKVIAEALEATGKSQRGLSKELGRSSSFINKVLMGTRPLEYTEFIDVCALLGLVPEEELKRSRPS